jgi:hypothetical protein
MEEMGPVEWLPPQAAGAAPPPQFAPSAVDPAWPPPAAPRQADPQGRSPSELWSLILGIAGLVLFVFPAGFGLVFIFNLPASIMAWVLGAKGRPGSRTGMFLGIAGVVLGVLAIVAWAVAIASSQALRDELRRAFERGRR